MTSRNAGIKWLKSHKKQKRNKTNLWQKLQNFSKTKNIIFEQ